MKLNKAMLVYPSKSITYALKLEDIREMPGIYESADHNFIVVGTQGVTMSLIKIDGKNYHYLMATTPKDHWKMAWFRRVPNGTKLEIQLQQDG